MNPVSSPGNLARITGSCLKTLLCWAALTACLLAPLPAGAASRCGAEGDWRSNLIPDIWPPPQTRRHLQSRYVTVRNVPVYKACIAHDQCYDTPGADRGECDRRFHQDMKAECDRVYPGLKDLPLRQACHGAAYGYFQAVDRYGRAAFQAAQKPGQKGASANPVVTARPGPARTAPPAPANAVRKAPENNGAATGLEWREWGDLPGVSGLAAYGKKLYAYLAGSGEVWVSPSDECRWRRLGQAPEAVAFAAGAGRLYLGGADGAIWVSGTGKLNWKKAGELPGVGALTVCGGDLIAWQRSTGRLLKSSVFKVAWKALGSVGDVRDLAGDHGKVFKIGGDEPRLYSSPLRAISWHALGPAKALGPVAVERGVVFTADTERGKVFSAQIH